VVLSGVHAEAPENWRRGMVFNTPASVDHAYSAKLILAALNHVAEVIPIMNRKGVTNELLNSYSYHRVYGEPRCGLRFPTAFGVETPSRALIPWLPATTKEMTCLRRTSVIWRRPTTDA
jgi:hypothetical protein